MLVTSNFSVEVILNKAQSLSQKARQNLSALGVLLAFSGASLEAKQGGSMLVDSEGIALRNVPTETKQVATMVLEGEHGFGDDVEAILAQDLSLNDAQKAIAKLSLISSQERTSWSKLVKSGIPLVNLREESATIQAQEPAEGKKVVGRSEAARIVRKNHSTPEPAESTLEKFDKISDVLLGFSTSEWLEIMTERAEEIAKLTGKKSAFFTALQKQ